MHSNSTAVDRCRTGHGLAALGNRRKLVEVTGEDELQAAKGLLAAPHAPGHLLQVVQHAPVHH